MLRYVSIISCAHFLMCWLFLLEANTSETFASPKNKEIKRIRLTWWSDPSTSAALGWEQGQGWSEVRYDERAHWKQTKELRMRVTAQAPTAKGEASWAHLTGLKPNTAYQLVIKTEDQQSAPMWFVTAPDQPSNMTFIVGGDSRNHRKVRREANQIVARLTPTAVLFGGDFTAQDTRRQWGKWFDDWQLSISDDGRLTPLVPARGNHDSERALIRAWGRAHTQFYYAFSLGGELIRIYTLNSERPAGGEQVAWLSADLKAHDTVTLKIAQYHKPMRPHSGSKMEGFDEYDHWAPLFKKHQLDLAIECDSHLMKVTWPLEMDESGDQGFKRVNKGGTVFIGEGGWGAPLRSVSDRKSWTMKSGRINHVFFIEIGSRGDYALRVLKVDSVAGNPRAPWREFLWRRSPNSQSSASSQREGD